MRISDWCSDVCSSDLREPVFGPGNAPRGPSRGKPGQAFAGPWSGSRGTMRKFFGTDGIRGLTNQVPMTAEVAMRVGMAAVEDAVVKANTQIQAAAKKLGVNVTGPRILITTNYGEDRKSTRLNSSH